MTDESKTDKGYTPLLNSKGKPTGFKTCNKCNRVLADGDECGLHEDDKVTKAQEKEHAAALASFKNPPPGVRPLGWRRREGGAAVAEVPEGTAMPLFDSEPVLHNEDMQATVSGSDVTHDVPAEDGKPHRRSRKENDD